MSKGPTNRKRGSPSPSARERKLTQSAVPLGLLGRTGSTPGRHFSLHLLKLHIHTTSDPCGCAADRQVLCVGQNYVLECSQPRSWEPSKHPSVIRRVTDRMLPSDKCEQVTTAQKGRLNPRPNSRGPLWKPGSCFPVGGAAQRRAEGGFR